MSINDPQPPPKPGKAAVWDLVIADMKERDRVGAEKYGTRLRTGNGRSVLACEGGRFASKRTLRKALELIEGSEDGR